MSTPLISLTDLRAALPIRDGNTQFDAKIALVAQSVSLMIETFCRVSFAKQTFRELHHVQVGASYELNLFSDQFGGATAGVVTTNDPYIVVPDGNPFRLFNAPLEVDTSDPVRVFYDPRHRFGPNTEIDQSRINVLADQGYVYVDAALVRSRDSVLITYTAGYDVGADGTLSASIPADLKVAAMTQCVYAFQRLDADDAGKQFDSGKVSMRYLGMQGGLLPEVALMLGAYRRLLRGRG